MSDEGFKVGDIVELLSGGPPMTVTEVNTNMLGHTEIVCRWWCGGYMQKSTFGPKHLKPGTALTFFELRTGGAVAMAPGEGAAKPAE